MEPLDLNPLELKMLEALKLSHQYMCGSILHAPTKEVNEAIELAEWVGVPTPMKIQRYKKRRK